MKLSSAILFLGTVITTAESVVGPGLIPLYGDPVNNNPVGPLDQCEGDCDNDSHCDGCLVCYQFTNTASELPPGCTGEIYNHPTAGVYDYCAEPINNPGCYGPPPTDPTSYGDPHFKTWSGKIYDFHGGCDLALLKNPQFANGLGMNIHIRTKVRTWWSFIDSVVIQTGDSTLQVTGGIGSSSYSINGADATELVTGDASLGDFSVHFRRVNDHHTVTRIDIGNGDAIGLETFKDFVRVNIKNKSNKSFHGSSGLYGSYPEGTMLARDGVTVMEDPNEFGQEWMVKHTDTILFHDVDAAQMPDQCAMPDEMAKKEGRRRLGDSAISEEDAALACARVNEVDRDSCIFDVMATQDKDMVGSY